MKILGRASRHDKELSDLEKEIQKLALEIGAVDFLQDDHELKQQYSELLTMLER